MAASLYSHLSSLLNSGKGSDLTIICDGCHFEVHKAIVTQSPVIAKPFDEHSNFEVN